MGFSFTKNVVDNIIHLRLPKAHSLHDFQKKAPINMIMVSPLCQAS